MELTFWGVRGSNAVSGEDYEKIGGNTACVSVRVNQEDIIIFDSGSGIFDLGRQLRPSLPQIMHIFISHPHLDLIVGLPFFGPLWDDKCKVHAYSRNDKVEETLREILLSPPLFPVEIDDRYPSLINHKISAGENVLLGSSVITTIALNHPGGSIGYKLEAAGHKICYITDVEHEPGILDPEIISFVQGCDLFIYDSAYTEEEYNQKRGWGHSTHIHAAKLAQAAGVKKLALFHQDPAHTDAISDQVEREAQAIFPEL